VHLRCGHEFSLRINAREGLSESQCWSCVGCIVEAEHRERNARRSVWFTWQAPASGKLALEAGTGTHVSIFTGGSVSALRPVATGASVVSFSAQSAMKYRIAVDGIRTKFALAWRPG